MIVGYPEFSQRFSDLGARQRESTRESNQRHADWQAAARQSIYEENLSMGGKTVAEIEKEHTVLPEPNKAA